MTWKEALLEGRADLERAKVPDPETDARLLLEDAGNLSRTRYLLVAGEEMPEALMERYREHIRLRGGRIPLQHITGTAWFMGFPFKVDSRVLIPRQDTETLAMEALAFLKQRGGAGHVLDLCTGSGCIAVSLRKLYPEAEVAAADISAQALEIARQNAAALGAEISFYQGDLFEALGSAGTDARFDLIVSNPPYIASAEIEELEEEVRVYDPRRALDGGEDGLSFYRRIIREARGHLNGGGGLFLEIGSGQAEQVKGLLEENGFGQIRVIQDLAGLDRVVTASAVYGV